MAAVLQAPTKFCSFLCVLLIILLFFVLDVYTFIAYDRHTLLEISSSVAHRKLDFEFLNAGALFKNTDGHTTETQRKKREESWRPLQTETPCLSTSSPYHSAGQRSVTGQQILRTVGAYLLPTRNKGLLHYLPHRNLLSVEIPDSAIELSRLSVQRGDRMKEFTGKSEGWGCLFLY